MVRRRLWEGLEAWGRGWGLEEELGVVRRGRGVLVGREGEEGIRLRRRDGRVPCLRDLRGWGEVLRPHPHPLVHRSRRHSTRHKLRIMNF